ncbi:type VI secretion system protein [Variovorax sp.]|uniref:type VI secretion system protein n=1 Tax=Variovorax sp. TaxID=1871043 RepID=UPI003BAA0C09
MTAMLPHDHRFWLLLVLCLAGFALLCGVVRDAGRGARRRALQRRIEALGAPASEAGDTELAAAALREGMAQAQQAVKRSRPRAPVPWFLFFGDAAANLPGLLSAAHGERLPAHEAGEAKADAWWHWWLTGATVSVEIPACTVGEAADTPAQRGLWLQSLLALAERRHRLPLNGMVACVSARDLLHADESELAALAARMRRLLDETGDTLRLQIPAYLVVTGLEQLAGYAVLRDALPPEVLSQAVGHRLTDASAVIATPPRERLDAVFDPLARHLHALRMSLLHRQASAADRLAVHEFVEAVRALQPGLRTFAQVLFENHGKGTRAPRWRGLYLTAAASPSHGVGAAFVDDLFSRFLPADQPLVRPGRPSPAGATA